MRLNLPESGNVVKVRIFWNEAELKPLKSKFKAINDITFKLTTFHL